MSDDEHDGPVDIAKQAKQSMRCSFESLVAAADGVLKLERQSYQRIEREVTPIICGLEQLRGVPAGLAGRTPNFVVVRQIEAEELPQPLPFSGKDAELTKGLKDEGT